MTGISLSDPWALLSIAVGLALGGILKGATGAGLPILAVPVIAAVYDVRFAVVVLVIPNFIINVLQIYKYRAHEVTRRFTWHIVVSGMIGAALGTWVLVFLPAPVLNLLMAAIIFVYIGLRLLRPDFRISREVAERTVWIAGATGGVLQGALGISAPATVTFLNAVRLPRPEFIFTASAFFTMMCVPQVILQTSYGLMTWHIAALGLLAVLPMMAALPVGEWLGKRMSPVVFDRAILTLLALLAVRQAASSGVF